MSSPDFPTGLPLRTLDGRTHHVEARYPGATDIEVWEASWTRAVTWDHCPGPKALRRLREMNGELLGEVAQFHPEAVQRVEAMIQDRLMLPVDQWESVA